MQHVRAAGDAQCTPFASLCRRLVGWPDGLDCGIDRHTCSKRDDVWSRLPPVAREHSCSGLFSLMRRSKSITSAAILLTVAGTLVDCATASSAGFAPLRMRLV